ncbi:MAG: DEAD/DEAH box helicase, partial [Desulfotomaculaceae bacterium]|nr:DEAD/DEAH box helicase [Desulfotomaculaceae bacterium]
MSEAFETLGLIAPLATGLQKAGIEVPTGIQALVIPLALSGKNIIGQSATGTGKTLAYLLPLFQKIDPAKRENQAMILAPTNELAIQIKRQIEMLANNSGLPVTSATIVGNVNIVRQIEKLREKPHIIVGSSSSILGLIQKRKITAHTIKTIILDEADRLLDNENLDSVKAVLKTTLKERQLFLFSATITKSALDRAKEFMREPEVVTVMGKSDVAPGIRHMYFLAEQRDKIEVLRKLLNSIKVERALVFINRSDNIENIVAKVNHFGFKAAGTHGGLEKEERKKSIEDFRNGKIQLLVATDLAARGLDIPGVEYVFNLDLPEDPQAYLHRAGRTGRTGQSGTAISIIAAREVVLIKKYEKVLNINILAKQIAKGRI